jgi:hypothetical protein
MRVSSISGFCTSIADKTEIPELKKYIGEQGFIYKHFSTVLPVYRVKTLQLIFETQPRSVIDRL